MGMLAVELGFQCSFRESAPKAVFPSFSSKTSSPVLRDTNCPGENVLIKPKEETAFASTVTWGTQASQYGTRADAQLV